MKELYDVAVIGGGPGGYTAAIRAAQLGGKVVLIEKHKLGGICNNYGCIPSKTMLRLAEIQANMKIADKFGIKLIKSNTDVKQLIENRNALLEKLANGIEKLLRFNGVKIIFGKAEIKSKNEISISNSYGIETIKSKNIIIATGSSGIKPEIFGSSRNVMNSEEFLSSDELPQNILIIGGGPEGVEFASMLSHFGCNVTIVEMLDRLLPLEDREVSERIEKILKDNGVKILTNTKVIEVKDDGLITKVKTSTGEILEAEKVIISTGRKPNTQNIGLENVGIMIDDTGKIIVNDKMETNVKGIYAIGDVVGSRYAHEAMENGIVAAENAMKLNSSMKGQIVPRCIYTIPEIACVGLTEEEARERYSILVGKFYLKASGRAMTLGNSDGFVKVIIDKKTKQFLGIHIMNDRASDMVGEALLAMKYLKSDDIINTIHPHPTLVESIKEAVLDAYGRSIHSFNLRDIHQKV
ncbi:MAG: dihydrolipoyl dehydrogenase [Candidatus Aenigmarchaeota archaeon]|nr:dihydrolipoyl dehydrogenase [Candidatus Aenigmarchaeota archaeon]